MTTDSSIQYAFTGGELSPDAHGRTDLEKHQLGAKSLLNCWVDFRGAAFNRPGLGYVAPIAAGDATHRLFPFKGIGSDYVLVFSDNTMRVVQDGGYVISDSVPIVSMTQSTTLEVTIGSGWSIQIGSLIYLDENFPDPKLRNRHLKVTASIVTVLTLKTIDDQNVILDNLGLNAGSALQLVYELNTGIGEDLLPAVQFEQDKFNVFLTSLDMPRRQLVFSAADDWSISEMANSSPLSPPGSITVTATSAGTAGTVFAVSSVREGRESSITKPLLVSGIVDYTDTAGQATIEWSREFDVDTYYIYRSLIVDPADNLSGGELLGFIGSSRGTQFVDNNITPDFTKTPVAQQNPFNSGGIYKVEIFSAGSGYTNSDLITISGNAGSGFIGIPLVDSAGGIQSVYIFSPGTEYDLGIFGVPNDGYTVDISGSGTGAAMAMRATPLEGLHPRTYARFQQRNVFAGSYEYPMTIWGTSAGTVNDYGIGSVVTGKDAYTFELDADSIDPIRHLLALRTGLLAFTQQEIFLLRAEEGVSVSPVNALSEPQAYRGVSDTEPVLIDLDVLFTERNGTALNAMLYTEYTNSFEMQDISLLSNHLLTDDKEIIRMSWFGSPHKLLSCVREDGVMLTVTYERAQNVFAWARQETQGFFRDIALARVDNRDTLYSSVVRYVDGRQLTYLEKFAPRTGDVIEDMVFLDSALTLPDNPGFGQLTIVGDMETVTLTTTTALLSVGDVVFAAGGRCEVTSLTSATVAEASVTRTFTTRVPQTDALVIPVVAADAWSYVTPTKVVRGLYHLEGETVTALCDGSVYEDLLVADGAITLPVAGARITVGLPYTSEVTTLSPTLAQQIVEGKRQSIKSVSLRLGLSRGLRVGVEDEQMYEIENRAFEAWGKAPGAHPPVVDQNLGSNFRDDHGITIQQTHPLPMKVISLVIDTLVGDD